MNQKKINNIIANREYHSKSGEKIEILVGAPEKQQAGPGFQCAFQIIGLGNREIEFGIGEDSMQALLHALQNLGAILNTSKKADEKKLSWFGTIEGDRFGLPIPSSMESIKK